MPSNLLLFVSRAFSYPKLLTGIPITSLGHDFLLYSRFVHLVLSFFPFRIAYICSLPPSLQCFRLSKRQRWYLTGIRHAFTSHEIRSAFRSFLTPVFSPITMELNSNFYSIIDFLESKSLSWIFIADHRDPWRATLSWTTFSLLTFAVPVLCHFAYHLRPFDWIGQVSLSLSSLRYRSLVCCGLLGSTASGGFCFWISWTALAIKLDEGIQRRFMYVSLFFLGLGFKFSGEK
ncbi:hypothetical protein L1987_83298 [Smallanthus sonchifolius]|uniref:Uncharacterized protein n=1 Tax=Smallanthus sonchifolius TaxID=185202 RepID=A0ACB8YCH9_9ASTR|nr:hypothetical protein L1987_83298 [Smallanthus sonchifolius]